MLCMLWLFQVTLSVYYLYTIRLYGGFLTESDLDVQESHTHTLHVFRRQGAVGENRFSYLFHRLAAFISEVQCQCRMNPWSLICR